MQAEHQVETREVAADVADAALVVHPQQPQPGPTVQVAALVLLVTLLFSGVAATFASLHDSIP